MLFNSHRAKHIMEEEKLDAIIFCSPENVYYASDFFNIGGYIRERAWAAMIFQDESLEPVLITPSNDVRLARAQTWMKDVRAYAVAELFTDVDKNFYPDIYTAIGRVFQERAPNDSLNVGMEYAMVPYRWIAEIQTRLKKHRIIDASEAIKRLVMVKTPQEIQYLRESARINVQAHLAFRDAIRAGVTEKDLGIAARQAAILNGTEVLFCFVGSGEFSFAAHKVRPLNKPIKIGDFVRVDMGCIVHGYVSDFARCYILGEAPSKDRETFGALAENIPLTAQEVIPGRTASEAYERSVKNIKRSLPNFGREFVGHGIGLTLHEEPFLKRGNDIVIEPNTVVSIELSEYCSGKRYHLENSFLVTERGVELISAGLPMELEILF